MYILYIFSARLFAVLPRVVKVGGTVAKVTLSVGKTVLEVASLANTITNLATGMLLSLINLLLFEKGFYHQMSTTNYVRCGGYGIPYTTATCLLLTAYCQMYFTAYCLLPVIFSLLTAYCQLFFNNYCLLPV